MSSIRLQQNTPRLLYGLISVYFSCNVLSGVGAFGGIGKVIRASRLQGFKAANIRYTYQCLERHR